MKIFGIGLNKTTTLAACLRELGFDHTSCDLELTRCAHQGELEPIFERADRYGSFEDWPWPLVYKELDQRYDDAKFIVTRRANEEDWFDSLERHAMRTGPSEYREIAYGHEMPHSWRKEHLDVYLNHNQEVRNYFSRRDGKLLEVCWEEGDGWRELCGFLNLSVPELEFPYENKGRSKMIAAISYLKNRMMHAFKVW